MTVRRWVLLHAIFTVVFALQIARMAAYAWVMAVMFFHVPQSAPIWFLFSLWFAEYITGEFDLLAAKYRELRTDFSRKDA